MRRDVILNTIVRPVANTRAENKAASKVVNLTRAKAETAAVTKKADRANRRDAKSGAVHTEARACLLFLECGGRAKRRRRFGSTLVRVATNPERRRRFALPPHSKFYLFMRLVLPAPLIVLLILRATSSACEKTRRRFPPRILSICGSVYPRFNSS